MTTTVITEKAIRDRIREMRGKFDTIAYCRITDTVFGDSENVYMAFNDAELWSNTEFVFVIPANVASYQSMIARGYWAETKRFNLPVVLGKS